MLAITNCKIFKEDSLLTDHSIIIDNGMITSVSNDPVPEGHHIVDAEGCYVSAGFLDLQIYGSGGNLFSAYPTADTLRQMDHDLISKGTTGFLACVATNAPDIVVQAINAAKVYQHKAIGFLGLHLEGPYLNPKRKGAHIEKYIKKASLEEVKKLMDKADGVVKMMTVAAELQCDEVLKYLSDQDVVLSLGHSNATFEQANEAFQRGFTTTTHLFNAMPSIHHRSPNLPAALLNHDVAMASIIADGQHVDFEMVKLSHKLMGDRLFLITDAVTTCDIGPYQHQLSGDKFTTPDGTLSGSNITLLQAVQNCVKYCSIPLSAALRMASYNPGRLMGLYHQKDSFPIGSPANLVFLNNDLQLLKVYVAGVEHLGIIN